MVDAHQRAPLRRRPGGSALVDSSGSHLATPQAAQGRVLPASGRSAGAAGSATARKPFSSPASSAVAWLGQGGSDDPVAQPCRDDRGGSPGPGLGAGVGLAARGAARGQRASGPLRTAR